MATPPGGPIVPYSGGGLVLSPGGQMAQQAGGALVRSPGGQMVQLGSKSLPIIPRILSGLSNLGGLTTAIQGGIFAADLAEEVGLNRGPQATSGRGAGRTGMPDTASVQAGFNGGTRRSRGLPPSAAVPGTGPSSNQVGSDADPKTPGIQGSGAPGARQPRPRELSNIPPSEASPEAIEQMPGLGGPPSNRVGTDYAPDTPGMQGSGDPSVTTSQEQRVSPSGVVQTGTNTGFKPMTLADIEGEGGLFDRIGIGGTRLHNPFSSNQLPTTPDHAVSAGNKGQVNLSDSRFNASEQSPGSGIYNAPQLVTMNVDGKQTAVPFNEIDSVMAGNKPSNINISTGKSNPGNTNPDRPTTPKAQWEEPDDGYGDIPTSGMSARSRAFLNAPDSLSGLRAAEATQGIVYAGGQHHIINPNMGQEGQNDFVAIDKSDARDYKGGRMSAQQLKDKYVKTITDKGGPADDQQTDTAVTPADDVGINTEGTGGTGPMAIKRGSEFDGQIVY